MKIARSAITMSLNAGSARRPDRRRVDRVFAGVVGLGRREVVRSDGSGAGLGGAARAELFGVGRRGKAFADHVHLRLVSTAPGRTFCERCSEGRYRWLIGCGT
jgi:hypothetical protein